MQHRHILLVRAGYICEEWRSQVCLDLPHTLRQHLLGWGAMGPVCQADRHTIALLHDFSSLCLGTDSVSGFGHMRDHTRVHVTWRNVLCQSHN